MEVWISGNPEPPTARVHDARRDGLGRPSHGEERQQDDRLEQIAERPASSRGADPTRTCPPARSP